MESYKDKNISLNKTISDISRNRINSLKKIIMDNNDLTPQPYKHWTLKEIHEQPRALTDTIEALIDDNQFSAALFGDQAEAVFQQVDSILILAAGTSYYAALTAKYWLESLAKLPTNVEIASEYRYRVSVPNPKQLIVTISQSGETLDTMEALKHAKSLGQNLTLAICNVQRAPYHAHRNWFFIPVPERKLAWLPPKPSPRS
jgi:glucosamine--fructose-6-phosphate aminotransferase (isomerizing)